MNLIISEHNDSGYKQRTIDNCNSADLTIAFAYDFTTAGEKLTKRSAGRNYLAIDKDSDYLKSSELILKRLSGSKLPKLNIAGNGIYTLSKFGINQELCNNFLFKVLSYINNYHPLGGIRSGGQTGIDTAGLVAGIKLKILTIGLYPPRYLRRNINGIDYTSTKEVIISELSEMANK